MQVITEPTVTLVAKTQFLGHPMYLIPDDGDDAVKLGAFAAKGCYSSYGVTGRDNIANQTEVLNHRHGSVLEHIHLSMFIEGISRALSLEFNRHRNLAISQRSTRYTKEEDSAIVLEPYYASLFKKYNPIRYQLSGTYRWGTQPDQLPDTWPADYVQLKQFLDAAEDQIMVYKNQVDMLINENPNNLSGFDLRKWSRGKARQILPHALETRVLYTANLRTWRWIIEVRSGKGAEPEIRRLAHVLLQTLKQHVQLYFADFEVSEIYDNIPVYVPKFSKV